MSEGLECDVGEIRKEDGEHRTVGFETMPEVVNAQDTLELEFCFRHNLVGGGDISGAFQRVAWIMTSSQLRFEERQKNAVVLAAVEMLARGLG